MTNAALIGYWKITKMEVWDALYVDLVVPGFIEFEMENDHLMGQFHFGTVGGWLDCRVRDVSGESYVEWSWEGRSDSNAGCGRGWAHLEDGELVGRLFIHCGDDSAFEAARQKRPGNRNSRRRPPKGVSVSRAQMPREATPRSRVTRP